MLDSELKEYLFAYGDRVALFAFCRSRTGNLSSESAQSVPHVVQRVRDRLMEQRRVEHTGDAVTWKQGKKKTNKNAAKNSRRIELGWLCYDNGSRRFQQVRKAYGGGTRHLVVPKEITMSEMPDIAIPLFFPGGTSKKGSAESFTFEIRDFSESAVPDDDTVEDIYDRTS
jgi:hypothetical protein